MLQGLGILGVSFLMSRSLEVDGQVGDLLNLQSVSGSLSLGFTLRSFILCDSRIRLRADILQLLSHIQVASD